MEHKTLKYEIRFTKLAFYHKHNGKIQYIAICVLFYIAMGILFFSCAKEPIKCTNYKLKERYNLQNSFSDSETYEKFGDEYLDRNIDILDNIFDAANFIHVKDRKGYFKDLVHFKLNFGNNSEGFFEDGNDNKSLAFNYTYFQDSAIILDCNNGYEYRFMIDENCKLKHCVYLVSTLKGQQINNYEVVYSTYCLNKTYKDVVNEFTNRIGINAPDTIGVNKFMLFEN
jgi:hypothetical protein